MPHRLIPVVEPTRAELDELTDATPFRTTVHGTLFGDRMDHVAGLSAGDPLLLIPDPPDDDDPVVWVHLPEGDPVGHLPEEICLWLAPILLNGGRASATIVRMGDDSVPSWKRVLIEVSYTPRESD